ncbi:hypothetical protein AGMMS49957_00550 [Synergistales bacterium]|nr:hypothetical protein AGMMS49957_00550 [Synergistales bacterium]
MTTTKSSRILEIIAKETGGKMENRIAAMIPVLNEKQLRRFLASEAKEYGRGGISVVL